MKRTLPCLLLLGSIQAFAQAGEAMLIEAAEGGLYPDRMLGYPVLLDEELPEEDVTGAYFELISFQADAAQGEGVVVHFATVAEGAAEHFVVERSADRIHWEVALEVSGQGRPGEYTTYREVDTAPLPGLSYYRLWRMGRDMAEEISDLYSVRYEGGAGLLIHSDVRPGHFVVRADGMITEVLFLNSRGQFVPMQMNIQGDMVQVNAERMEPGVYYVQAIVNGTSIMRPVHIGSDTIIGG